MVVEEEDFREYGANAMKNKIYFCLIFLFFAFVNFSFCYASINVVNRNVNDLQVWNTIEINDSVKDSILTTPKVDETQKIYDFADLLNDTEEKRLYVKIKNFIQKYEIDMVVVTINYNPKMNPQKYVDDFYRYNYFGMGENHDGIILLIDMNYRTAWISVYGDTQTSFDNTKLSNILEELKLSLKNKDYYSTVLTFINDSEKYVQKEIINSQSNQFDFMGIIEVIVISTIGTTCFILIGLRTHKDVNMAKLAKKYLKEPSLDVTFRKDELMRSSTTKF